MTHKFNSRAAASKDYGSAAMVQQITSLIHATLYALFINRFGFLLRTSTLISMVHFTIFGLIF
jgi:hypothetical protein